MELPNWLVCPVCFEGFHQRDPFCAPCGHAFCLRCVQSSRACPLCRKAWAQERQEWLPCINLRDGAKQYVAFMLEMGLLENGPQLSDVEITCYDHEVHEVLHAHRNILQKRCPALLSRCDYVASMRKWHYGTHHSYKVMQALWTHMLSGDFDSGTLESDAEGLLYASVDFSLNDFRDRCSGGVYGSFVH